MKNWAGNAIGFAKDFANNLSNFFLGNPLDKGGNIKPLDPRHKGPGFHGLPEHQQEKEYELLRKLGPQASKKDLYDNYVMQGNPFLLDLAGTGKRMNEVGLNPWGSGEVTFAGAPRYIKYGGPPNSIIKAPHADSPLVDKWLDDYRLRDTLRGPQLPGFV